MVGSRGKGRASTSKSNSKNLLEAEAEAGHEPEPEPDPLQISCADDPLDREETNEISNEEENTAGGQTRDEIICGTMVVEGHEVEQLETLVNGEENDAANEINADTAENAALSQTVEVSEPTSDGVAAASAMENEEKINEVVPGEDKEKQMRDEFMNEDVEAGAVVKNSEIDTEGNMDNNEGLPESDHSIMEEKFADNVQNEEANKVNSQEAGTAADNEKIECKGEGPSMANDVNSVTQKVTPGRKVLKKKVVKKKMVVQGNVAPMDEAKLQSFEDEASSEVDKGTEAGEEMKILEVSAEESMNVIEGLHASEHEIIEEKLVNDVQNEEASMVNTEETTDTLADNGKIECAGEDARIANDVKSISEKPKRKVFKKKLIKKKTVVLNDEAKSQSAVGDEVSAKADTNEDAKNEDKAVLGDNGKIDLAVDSADNIKVDTEKANGPKKRVIKKVLKKKVAQGDVVASMNKAKAQISVGNDPSGKTDEADKTKDVRNVEKSEVKAATRVNKKRKRNRKKKAPEARADPATIGGEPKPKTTNNEAGTNKNKATDRKNATTKENVKSEDKLSSLHKGKKQKMVKEDAGKTVADGINVPGPSKKSKSSKRSDGMGMIFMCSSATKKDCYRYKVFGLPASKKDIVSKIYVGMRLFLFDVDLRMMYGIYKAAGPGGYNIEPKAFKSQFPSQVRFTVLNDCVPLAEEKFKNAIKDNYYTRNKFNCQLTSEQVKNLCKLFTETSQRAESKTAPRALIPAAPSSSSRDRKRKRPEDSHKARPGDTQKAGRIDSREARHIPPIELERSRRWVHEEVRRPPIVIDDRYHHPVYEREAYRPPTVPTSVYHLSPQHPPRTSYSYDYEEASRVDIEVYRRDPALDRRLDHPSSRDSRVDIEVYRRDPALNPRRLDHPSFNPALDHQRVDHPSSRDPRVDIEVYRRDPALNHRRLDHPSSNPALDHPRVDRPSSRDWGRSIAAPSNLDPYIAYRETHVYREPVCETSVRHEAAYETASVRPTEHYGAADYPAPLPPYRRY